MSHAPAREGLSNRLRAQSGQAIVLAMLFMIPLMGFVGLVVDVGHAYYTQRSLQASADAAALAGASQLPDPAAAAALAKQYGAAPGEKNARANVTGVTDTISTRCATSLAGCYPSNVITVKETGSVSTPFLGLFGVKTISVSAQGSACGPCGGRPVDLVLIYDRTLSMCMDFYGNQDPSCSKLNNARAGMETLLSTLDPAQDHVGLVVLPPATTTSSRCTAPPLSVYNSKTAAWLLVPLTSQYQLPSRALDHNSLLVSTIDCLPAAGDTAYANAIDSAQAELNKDGRANAEHVIVFFTDGAANTGPTYYPVSSPYREQPCHQGVTSAGLAKAQGTLVYAIGYTLNGMGGSSNRCQAQSYNGPDEQPPITAYDAVSEIASSASTFFNQPAAGSLQTIFAQIGADVTGPRLISDDTP
jgi:Flp pilus assembly protein TadG